MHATFALVMTLALGLLVGVAAPIVAADPIPAPGKTGTDCIYIDPWSFPVHYEISPDDCVPR